VTVLLGWLLSGVELIGTYVLWALESAFNLVLVAIIAAYAAAVALLPSMTDAPSFGSPTWLGWLSWFYPVGDLVAGLFGLLTMWLGYLAVRYVLRLVRGL
jgi:hypothetical protein